MDRTFRSCDSYPCIVAIHQSENGNDDGGREPKGPDRFGRSDAVWKGETGHRPHLQVK